MKKEIYDIDGMLCAVGSSSAERVTSKPPGVVRSDVNLPLNRLTISYDETLCTHEDIISKIEKAGFTATVRTEKKKSKPATDVKKQLDNKKLSLIISVVSAALLLFISMGQMLFPNMPLPDIISMETHPFNFALLQLLLCIFVLFLSRRFFVGGFSSLFHGNPNMDTLVALSAALSIERLSAHPISGSVCERASALGIDAEPAKKKRSPN